MTHTPKVSIVVPFYNPSSLLLDCVSSVLNQDYENIEVILVNDGSTTVDIISLLPREGRVRLVNQVHLGVSEARNTGLKLATGEYVCFLDADDFFENKMILELVRSAESAKSDIVSCGFYFYDHQTAKDVKLKKFDRTSTGVLNKLKCRYSLFQIFSSNIWDKLYRLSFIKENNLKFENLVTCNDFSFAYVAIIKAKVISIVNKPLLHYRINQKGNISSNRGAYASNIFVAIRTVYDRLVADNLISDYGYSFVVRAVCSILHEFKNCSWSQKGTFLLQGYEVLSIKALLAILNCFLSPLFRKFRN